MTFLLIVVAGPDWAFTLAAGARDRVVLPAVTGLVIGYTLLSVLVAAGVGAFVARSPLVLTTLTAVGAGYLVHLQLAALGFAFVAICGASFTLVGYGARAILGARPAAARRVSRMSGAAMVLVGLLLLVERVLVDH